MGTNRMLCHAGLSVGIRKVKINFGRRWAEPRVCGRLGDGEEVGYFTATIDDPPQTETEGCVTVSFRVVRKHSRERSAAIGFAISRLKLCKGGILKQSKQFVTIWGR